MNLLTARLRDGRFRNRRVSPAIAVPRFPFAGAQTPDFYAREYPRTVLCPRARYAPRLAVRTSWTNLLTRSNTPAHAVWTPTGLTATDAVAANPNDGALTAGRIVETTANSAHQLTRALTTTNALQTFDLAVAMIGDRWLRIHSNDGIEDHEAWIQPSTGLTKRFADVINATTLNGSFATAGGGGADVVGSWSESNAGTTALARDTSTVFGTDAASLRIDVDGSNSAGAISQGVLTLGRRYRLTYWHRTNRPGGLTNAQVTASSASAADTVAITNPGADAWGSVSHEFTAGTGALSISRPALSGLAGYSYWIARVVLTPLDRIPLIAPGVRNGGFETAGGGGADTLGTWIEVTLGTATVTRDTSVFDSGTASCKLTNGAGGHPTDFGAIALAGLLRPGARYRLAVRARRGAVGELRLFDTTTVFDPGWSLTTSFASYSYDFTATDDDLTLYPLSANAEVWLDQVVLTCLDSDLPVIALTELPWPAEDWFRASFTFTPRAATGTLTLALSDDGTRLSYTGSTSYGAYLWCMGLYLGSTLGPMVETLGSARTIECPDLDEEDPFAYLVAESEPTPVAGDLLRVERTTARLPAQQLTRDYQARDRPDMHGLRSSGTYAGSVDGGKTNHLWTSRKAVQGAINNSGTITNNTLPSANSTITLTDASSASFATNADAATIKAALEAGLKAAYPNKLSSISVSKSADGSSVLIAYLTHVGGPTISTVTVPTGADFTHIGNQIRIFAFGTTITPDTKLILCDNHGGSVGEPCVLWNGHTAMAAAAVAGVSDAGRLAVVLSDFSSPDFNINSITFAAAASVRYARGTRTVNVRKARDFYLAGVTMLSDGTTLSTLDSLPAVATYDSAQAELDRLVAGDTYTAITASELGTYLGPIVTRDTVSVKKDATYLESVALT